MSEATMKRRLPPGSVEGVVLDPDSVWRFASFVPPEIPEGATLSCKGAPLIGDFDGDRFVLRRALSIHAVVEAINPDGTVAWRWSAARGEFS